MPTRTRTLRAPVDKRGAELDLRKQTSARHQLKTNILEVGWVMAVPEMAPLESVHSRARGS